MDIVTIVMAWGLEISFPIEEVEWVVKNPFPKDLLGQIESFLWWLIGVYKELCTEQEKQAWTNLKREIESFLEESEKRVKGFFENHPKKRRSVG